MKIEATFEEMQRLIEASNEALREWQHWKVEHGLILMLDGKPVANFSFDRRFTQELHEGAARKLLEQR